MGRWTTLALAGLLAAGCGEAVDDGLGGRDAGGPVADSGVGDQPLPDFSLVDTNPTSPYSGEAVSPRQFLQQVSGWYFTHAS